MINDDKLSSLERLHKLKTDGVITEGDFEKAKNDLLNGPAAAAPRPRPEPSEPKIPWDGSLPAPEDYIGWATLPLRRYAQFSGRSTAKEFWMFMAFVFVVAAGCVIVTLPMGEEAGATLFALCMIGLFIPLLAVEVRRFHDQDKSGWFVLFNIIPYIGWLIVWIMMTIGGTHGENRFGPDPKQREL